MEHRAAFDHAVLTTGGGATRGGGDATVGAGGASAGA